MEPLVGVTAIQLRDSETDQLKLEETEADFVSPAAAKLSDDGDTSRKLAGVAILIP